MCSSLICDVCLSLCVVCVSFVFRCFVFRCHFFSAPRIFLRASAVGDGWGEKLGCGRLAENRGISDRTMRSGSRSTNTKGLNRF